MSPDQIIEALKDSGATHEQIAEAIGRGRTAATNLMNGNRRIQVQEIDPLLKLIEKQRRARNRSSAIESFKQLSNFGDRIGLEPDHPEVDPQRAYVPVDILPTFAGMGGGGNGEGDVERALVPRYLIEDVFRGRPSDFI